MTSVCEVMERVNKFFDLLTGLLRSFVEAGSFGYGVRSLREVVSDLLQYLFVVVTTFVYPQRSDQIISTVADSVEQSGHLFRLGLAAKS